MTQGTLEVYNFDIDDNILCSDTKIYGYVIINKTSDYKDWTELDFNKAVENGDLVKKAFSTDDFAIAKNEDTKFVFDFNNAFVDFRDFGPKGSDVFPNDMRTAIKAGKFAPSWNDFKKCLIEGSLFSFITARGHAPSSLRKLAEMVIEDDDIDGQGLTMTEYINLVEYLRQFHGNDISGEDVISCYLDDCDFMGVSSQEFADRYLGGVQTSPKSPSEFKEMFLKDFFSKCNKIANRHNLKLEYGLSDDDKDNVDAVIELFKLLKSQYSDVTFAVYDTAKYKDTKYLE